MLQPVQNVLLALLDETFDTHRGCYLDPGTSLFATLELVGASEASIPGGNQCATLAAQVAHGTLYIDTLERDLRGLGIDQVDWGDIWPTVAFDPLTQTYTREVRSEKWRDGVKLAAEQYTLKGQTYLPAEVQFMVQRAGFGQITPHEAYSREAATADTAEVVFVALKS